ncbi:MAG: retropepsin-like domain-containing protein [Acidobacteria bacterium]|nr:retropepsin-like domain-containing protein [Acidobacteriota bacterium]
MSKAKLAIALITLSVATVVWAVPDEGIAHRRLQTQFQGSAGFVAPIGLRDDRDRGLTATAWINGAGPFTFAVDTGAGVSLISRSVVERARLAVSKSRRPLVGGLSTAPIASNQEARLSGLSLGTPNNRISTNAVAAVVPSLPGSIDGILDPTDVFSPLGFSVDLPQRQLRVFDANAEGLRLNQVPRDGAVVRWVREAGNGRPFVRLSDGRLALIDTGSGFGLAVTDARISVGRNHGEVENRTDLGGGRVQSHEVAPQTVSIGSLVLRNVPTDVLRVAPGTPLILGRRALFPFKITFDPVAHLISFEPTERD